MKLDVAEGETLNDPDIRLSDADKRALAAQEEREKEADRFLKTQKSQSVSTSAPLKLLAAVQPKQGDDVLPAISKATAQPKQSAALASAMVKVEAIRTK